MGKITEKAILTSRWGHNQIHPQITYFQRHIAKLYIKMKLDLQE